MLEAVGHPRVVNPDRALRKIARERHWPVLAFGARSPAERGDVGQKSPAGANLLAPAAKTARSKSLAPPSPAPGQARQNPPAG